eukprot:3043736-Amphidinium_carterae.3
MCCRVSVFFCLEKVRTGHGSTCALLRTKCRWGPTSSSCWSKSRSSCANVGADGSRSHPPCVESGQLSTCHVALCLENVKWVNLILLGNKRTVSKEAGPSVVPFGHFAHHVDSSPFAFPQDVFHTSSAVAESTRPSKLAFVSIQLNGM